MVQAGNMARARGGFTAPALGGPQYPSSGAEFTALTGLTASSLYLFDEASGTLDDKVGAADLAVNLSPTFGSTQQGRRGIYYDGSGDWHGANGVNIPTAASFICTTVTTMVADVDGFQGVHSCWTAGADPGWGSYLITTPGRRPAMLIRDAAAGSTGVIQGANVDWPTLYPGLWLWSLQVDRANAVARTRISSGGRLLESEFTASLAGVGDLFGGTQLFAYGAGNALVQGMWCGWSTYLTGAQCEGASVLANLHRALGWE